MQPDSHAALLSAVVVMLGLHGGTAVEGGQMGGARLSAGQVETILTLPVGSSPEGVALDRHGNIFVGSRPSESGAATSDILRISPDGSVSVLATLAVAASPGTPGLLGLAIDGFGQIYAAVASFNASTHGVWRISPDGTMVVRLPGSAQIPFPNALAFGARSELYITDSAGGSIWRVAEDGIAREWTRHALLAPVNPNDPLIPPVGANGIAFSPPDTLYVANTQRGLIARVVIERDGSPGPLTTVATGVPLLTIDGIAVDVRGDIHGVVAGFALIGTHPLVRVEPHTGTITQTPTSVGAFDVPLGIAFATGPWDPLTVFVTNGALDIGVDGPGPGLVQAALDVPGVVRR